MYKLISDGGCDFTPAEAKQHNVDIVPFYVCFENETHLKEGVDITREEYFNRLLNDKTLFPKTSQPSPQDYIDVFTPHLAAGHDILILTISSKLSGSHNSASLAADQMQEEFPNRKIVLLDSLNVTIGQALILREIIKMRNAGFSLEETALRAKDVIKSTHLYCTLDSLEYLKRGGRVGPTTALVGGILGLRPILYVKDGEVTQAESVRGKKRALKMMEEAIIHTLKSEQQSIALSIGHIMSGDEAESFKTNTETALGTKIENPIAEVGVTIGTHAGPGAIAFAYCKKYEYLGTSDQQAQQTAQQSSKIQQPKGVSA